MTFKLKALLVSAAIGMALTACKAAENTVQKTASTLLPTGITKIETIAPGTGDQVVIPYTCLLYTSPSPRDGLLSRMPSSA